MTDPEGGVSSYVYDSLNRLTGLTDFNGGAFNFSYDPLGRRTNLARPNGVSTAYSYDNLSRLLAIVHQGSTFTGGTSYSYDAVGNRTTRTDTLQQAGQDPALTGTSYTYDTIYQLTQAVVNGATTETYTYDAVGNRLRSFSVASYTYNASNELISAGSKTFTYDANGNTLTKSAPNGTSTYTWDFENRLTSVSLPNGSATHYRYDPFGRRIFSDGTGRIFVYDGDNLIEDLDLSGKAVARYTQGSGIDEPLEVFGSGAASYYEADGLGSITSLSSATGGIANTYTYDSFGDLTSSTSTVSNRFLFTAREGVAKTGLLYYRARYYDPFLGRFLSEDPMRLSVGEDLYVYADNNPVIFTDPSGLVQCLYVIGAHTLSCTSYDYTESFETAQARSGNGDCMNEPACQHRANEGPIPVGNYYMGAPGETPRPHPVPRVQLTKMRGTITFGRGGFQVHQGNDRSSRGCITLDPAEYRRFLRFYRKDNTGWIMVQE